MIRFITRYYAVTAVALTLMLAGCSDAIDPRVASLRDKLMLKSSPGVETAVSKFRSTLKEEGAEEQMNVIIKGRITAGDMPPFEPGKAAFVLTDATGHEGEEDHDPHTCPFCSRNIKDYLAKVRFLDADGKLIDVDSRELFDVKEKQMVMIQGSASIDQDDMLDVTATEIYVLP